MDALGIDLTQKQLHELPLSTRDFIQINKCPSASSHSSNLSKYSDLGDAALKKGHIEDAVHFYMKPIHLLAPNSNKDDHLNLERCKEYCIMTSMLLKVARTFLKDKKNEGAHKSLQAAEVLIRKVVNNDLNVLNEDEGEISMVDYSAMTLLSKVMEASGDTYSLDKDFTMAEVAFQKTISCKRKSLIIIKTDVSVAKVFNDRIPINLELAIQLKKIGGILQKRGNYSESATAYSEALSIRQNLEEDGGHNEIINLLSSLADVYRHSGEISSALHCMDRLSKILRKEGKEKELLFKTALKKSELYVITEDYTQAMDAATITLDLANSEGFDYNQRLLSRAAATEQIARILEAQENMHDAILWHQRCKTIRSEVLPETNKLVLKSMRQIAQIRCKQGEHDIAETLYKEMRDKIMEKHGVENTNMADILDDLGCIYTEIKDFSSAKNCHKKALDIRRMCKDGDRCDSDFAITLEKLARLCLKSDRCQAMDYFNETLLVLRQNHFCAQHPAVIRTLHEMTTFQPEEDGLDSTSVYMQLSKWNGIGV